MVSINDLKEGDVMLSYNVQTHQFYPNIVQKLVSYNVYTEYIINGNVGTDSAEKFYTYVPSTGAYGWVFANNLTVGDEIYSPVNNTYIKVSSIQVVQKPNGLVVYDPIGTSSNDFVAAGTLADSTATPGSNGGI